MNAFLKGTHLAIQLLGIDLGVGEMSDTSCRAPCMHSFADYIFTACISSKLVKCGSDSEFLYFGCKNLSSVGW